MDIEKKLVYEGKSKALYKINSSKDHLLMRFKDDVTAFNNEKHDIVKGKGFLNNQICSRIYKYLGDKGIPNHYVMSISDTYILVEKTDVIPIEVVVRNCIAGGLVKRFGIEDRRGDKIKVKTGEDRFVYTPIVELFYKRDKLGDPLMNEDHAIAFGFANRYQIDKMIEYAHCINYYLEKYFDDIGIVLADFKLEFGVNRRGKVILVDDICPDGCRLWDKYTGKSFDKDNYRYNYGDVLSSYREVYKRILAVCEEDMHIGDYIRRQLHKKLEETYYSYISGQLDGLYWDVKMEEHNEKDILEPIIEMSSEPLKFEDIKNFTVKDNIGYLTFSREK